jgi:hypothetical protein
MKTQKQRHKHYLHRARMASAAACAAFEGTYTMSDKDGVHLREPGYIPDVDPFTRYRQKSFW